MRRLGLVLLAGGLLGLTAEWVGFGWGDPRHWIPDLAVGWTFVGSGLIAWARRPAGRTGPLLAATGFTWFLGNFAQVGVAAVAWAAAHLVYLHRGPLVQLVLTYPSGRPGSRLVRGAVAVGYAAAVITPIWRNTGATILLAGLLVAVCARDYVRAVGPFRRARLMAVQAAAGLSLVLAGTAAARLLLPPEEVSGPSLLVYEVALCVLAVTLLAGLLVAPWQRAVVTDLVVELGEARSGTLRGELSQALGDPSLEVGYWLPDRAVFVDAEGRVLSLPGPGSGRSVTTVEREGQPVAVLVHDPAVLEDPGLLEAVTSAARRAAANARLQADDRPPTSERGSSSPTPRTSSPKRWRSCAGSGTGCIRACCPSRGWRARWRPWPRTSRSRSTSTSQAPGCPGGSRWPPTSSAPRPSPTSPSTPPPHTSPLPSRPAKTGSRSRSPTTASAGPIPRTDRAYGASPTGSRPSAGRFGWKASPTAGHASPPTSRSAARRRERFRDSADLDPGLRRP